MESLDAERIGVQGDPEPEGDSPSSALAGTLSPGGEGMDLRARFVGTCVQAEWTRGRSKEG